MPGAAIGEIFIAAFWTGVKKFALKLLITIAISKALAPKKPKAVIQPTTVEYSGTLEGRKLIFGQNKIAGMQVIPPLTSGIKGDYLHQVLALGQGPVSGITDVYFDQVQIASANIAAVSGAAGDGNVTAGTFANRANIRRYVGTSSQAADFILDTAFTEWTSSHQGKEIAYIAYRYQVDTAVYKSGQKPEVAAITQGWLLYDPRQDSGKPGGSGGESDSSPATWTYGSGIGTNPALILRRYLTDAYGLGCASTEIDETNTAGSVQVAATECEESVSLPASGSEKRYTCSTVLDATNDWQDNVKILTDAMLGACYWSGGKWRMFAGSIGTSAFALTENDIAEVMSIRETPANDRFNAVKGSFIDPARNYQALEFEPRSNTTYETEDGAAFGKVWRELELPACQSNTEAQRYAMIVNRIGRHTKRVEMTCFMTAFKIRPYEIGTVTSAKVGWTSQTVRCEAWAYLPDKQQVRLSLVTADASDFNDPQTSDYGSGSTAAAPVPVDRTPSPTTDLTAISGQSVNGEIVFTWTLPAELLPGDVVQLFEHTSVTPFSSATKIASTVGSTVKVRKSDTTTRYYWTRILGLNGKVSDTDPPVNGVPGAATTVASAWDASVAPGSLFKVVHNTGTATTAAAVVSILNGHGGATYSWTKLSGDTITITSSTSASTTFGATGLTNGEERNAIFQCAVTDTPDSKNVTVSVTCVREDSL